jgi:putative endonuclease
MADADSGSDNVANLGGRGILLPFAGCHLTYFKPATDYILINVHNMVLHTGSTNNLRKRIYHHKHRLVPGFLKKYNVYKLVYYESLPGMATARGQERQIKGMSRVKKEALINARNQSWSELVSGALAPETSSMFRRRTR